MNCALNQSATSAATRATATSTDMTSHGNQNRVEG